MEQKGTFQKAELQVRNIGGIDDNEVSVEPGVTILSGRNATNRTSLLQGFMAALGSSSASLKGDADEGEAVIEIGDETYTRTLQRSGGNVAMRGDPYLEDAEIAELFAFLLESNEARRAVTTNGNLREILLRPIDTDEIEREIRQLSSEKEDIAGQLDQIESKKRRLPELESKRNDLESKIAEKRSELEQIQEEIEEIDDTSEKSSDKEEELDEAVDRLNELRSDLEEVRFDIETEQESLQSLEEESTELSQEVEEFSDEDEDIGRIAEKVSTLQERRRSHNDQISQLQDIIQFNEEMLEGTNQEIQRALGQDERSSESVTDQLVEDNDNVVCWTCGTEVERKTIEETIDRMRSLQQEKMTAKSDLEAEIEELQSKRREIKQTRERREKVQNQLQQVTKEIEEREERIESLRERRSELEAEIDTVESNVEELRAAVDTEEKDDLIELNKTANEIEFSLGRLERDLETTTETIEEIEADLEKQDQLEDRREEIRTELEELRTRIERIERDAVDSFNEHMSSVLDVLEYSNLDRIWIERVEETVREGRRNVDQVTFNLHVVRSAQDGTAYEDTIEHLSESEREVTGLIFALAGYLVHEVYHEMPFMLLDSLEALDSERIASLVDYFEEYTEFLVVALLPEDSTALSEEHSRITEF